METPELMGYDRAITVFTPDGRLLQVEYARKTVSQGTAAIGIVCKDGVVLITDKRLTDKLVVPSSIEKIHQIDEHIGSTMSGLVSDGRVLMERAQTEAQKHKIVYGEPVDVPSIVRNLCNYMQFYTQYGGTRPFGVSLLIAGVNHKPVLYITELSGVYFEYKAVAIGEGSDLATKILEASYKDSISMDQGIKLGVKIIKKILGNRFKAQRLEIAVVPMETKKFKKLSDKEIRKGLTAGNLKEVFGTDSTEEIAREIITKGEVQLTQEYRKKLLEKKIARIVNIISSNAFDPTLNAPIPPQRIKLAMDQAKVRIDLFKSDKEVMDEITQSLKKILPISFEKRRLRVIIPAQYAMKAYSLVNKYKITENWLASGDLEANLEVLGGLVPDIYDKLNNLTHGNVDIKEVN